MCSEIMTKKRPLLFFICCIMLSTLSYYTFWSSETLAVEETLLFFKRTDGTCSLPKFESRRNNTFLNSIDCSSNTLDCSRLDATSAQCEFRLISRKSDMELDYSSWSQLKSFTKWNDSNLLEVKCPRKSSLFSDYCLHRKISYNQQITSGLRDKTPKFPVDIVMIGLDSLSRSELYSQLPETYSYVMEGLGGVSMNGYTIVGDGTTAAFLAMLTGSYEEDFHEIRRGFDNGSPLDDLPFVWKELHNHGYVTLHDETDPGTGTFQLRLLGFEKPPVHYYGRPFQMASTNSRYHNLCIGKQSRFKEGLSNIDNLFKAYPNHRKFAIFFDGLLTHSEYPRADLLDQELHEYIKNFVREGRLNSTMLVLFSDHGPRYGKSRQTVLGKYKERSPFFIIVLPKIIRERHPDIIHNLKWNGNFILTTPFDIHATFLDILGNDILTHKGKSLFTKIPASRTCQDASMAAHWCPCAFGEPLDVDSHLVKKAMAAFLESVNKWIVVPGINCIPLTSASPSSASIIKPDSALLNFQRTSDGHGRVPDFIKSPSELLLLSIIFKSEPGGATWEATFEIDKSGATIIQPSQISRTNAYGNAADCVSTAYPFLRKFCVCDFAKMKVL